jgi:hypothetical protein
MKTLIVGAGVMGITDRRGHKKNLIAKYAMKCVETIKKTSTNLCLENAIC